MRYRPNATVPDETKGGYVIYSGSAYEFHHWQFRTELKMSVSKEEDVPKTASSIVEFLRGEALSIAMTVGLMGTNSEYRIEQQHPLVCPTFQVSTFGIWLFNISFD